MGVDRKYGQVICERGRIGPTEPVVVFRAQDLLLPQLLAQYADLCREAGSPPAHVAGVEETKAKVLEWQADSSHHVQVPGSASA